VLTVPAHPVLELGEVADFEACHHLLPGGAAKVGEHGLELQVSRIELLRRHRNQPFDSLTTILPHQLLSSRDRQTQLPGDRTAPETPVNQLCQATTDLIPVS